MRRLPSTRPADLFGARLAAALFAAAGTCAAAESAAGRSPADPPADPPVRLAPFEPVLPLGGRPLPSFRADLAGDSIRLAGGFETIPEIEPATAAAPATKLEPATEKPAASAGPKLDATLLLDADESAGPAPYRCGREAHTLRSTCGQAVWKFELAGIQIEWRLDGTGASAAAVDDSLPEPSALGAASHRGGPCVAEGACATGKPRYASARAALPEAPPSEAAQSVLDVMSQLGSVLDRSEMFADEVVAGAPRCGSPARRERLLQVLHDLETETPLPEPSAIPGRHTADAEPIADDEPADPDQLWERALALRSAASELDHVADRLEAAAVYDQADELRAQGQRLRVEARGLVETCRALARQVALKPRSF